MNLVYIQAELFSLVVTQSLEIFRLIWPRFASLPVENHIVHFPELALQAGGFGCLGGRYRIYRGWEREVAIHDSHILRVIFAELLHHGSKLGAVRSLKIAVLHDGHAGVFRSLDPVIELMGVESGDHSGGSGWEDADGHLAFAGFGSLRISVPVMGSAVGTALSSSVGGIFGHMRSLLCRKLSDSQ